MATLAPSLGVTLRGARSRPARTSMRTGRMSVRAQAKTDATDVVIVGGGVAGLCCAKRLHQVRKPDDRSSSCASSKRRTPDPCVYAKGLYHPAPSDCQAGRWMQAGVSFVLLEAAEDVGGRVRTSKTDDVRLLPCSAC